MTFKAFKLFFTSVAGSGVLIFGCVVLSLIIANTSLSTGFQELLDTQWGWQTNSLHLRYPLQLWINDGLMAIFFLMVGLEIKREMVQGELATPKKALLPIICAVGGAIVPALIFALFNNGKPTASGWGIPMATDIAFALAIIGMLSKRVPTSLKIFLAALAIVDDLIAILVIAIFYAGNLQVSYLLYAGAVVLLLVILNRFKVLGLIYYLIPGVFLWYFIHQSGVHATIAGVIVALFIPATGVKRSIPSRKSTSPLEKLEHLLETPVNYLIVPLFALANTNITFQNEMIAGIFSPLGLGIIAGLVVGKPIGILLVSFLSVKTRICQLPEHANWKHVAGVGLLAGIGFTMSIFMAILSFTDLFLIAEAKFFVLLASVISAFLGYFLLRSTSKK
ncbi:MAG: Na+/H+ antiporter NhaA [Bacteroidota bacterium]